MERIARARWFVFVVLLVGVIGGVLPAAAQGTAVPIPDFKPMPATATSFPMMQSDKLQTVVDLPKAGYVEEEFLVSGRANIYDWAPNGGGVVVKTPNAPYTTRILVRRPMNPQRFSGNVIIEVPNAARRFDFNFAWGVSHDYFIENGDAFIVVTLAQANLEALKIFDPMRYAPLSFANPTPDESCVVGRGGNAVTSTSEEGLVYDILSQVAALLKAARPGGPMAGFNVQRAYMTAYDAPEANYMVGIHPRAKMADGKPVYDGYVQNRNPTLGRLRRCGVAPAADDPRNITRNVDVPLIRIVSETDVMTLSKFRREDSDAPGDRYRLYEVAGGAHADGYFYWYYPTVDVLKKVGSPYPLPNAWPFLNNCGTGLGDPKALMLTQKTPINTYVMDAAFANLTRWIKDGVPAPKAARIQIENVNTPMAKVVRDQYGNAMGGYRTPYLDVPAATYVESQEGEGFCDELGRTDPFTWARLTMVHGSPQNYVAKVNKSVDQLVKDRFLTESDGKKIKAEAGAITPRATN
jgi:hypothetical protein